MNPGSGLASRPSGSARTSARAFTVRTELKYPIAGLAGEVALG
jgi:hypothetical protein